MTNTTDATATRAATTQIEAAAKAVLAWLEAEGPAKANKDDGTAETTWIDAEHASEAAAKAAEDAFIAAGGEAHNDRGMSIVEEAIEAAIQAIEEGLETAAEAIECVAQAVEQQPDAE